MLLASACGHQSPSAPSAPATPPPSIPTVDQSYLQVPDGSGGIRTSLDGVVQTFRVGIAGRLTGVDLSAFGEDASFLISGCSGDHSDLTVDVWSPAGDANPLSSLLTSGTAPLPRETGSRAFPSTTAALLGSLKHVDFQPPVRVVLGQTLTLSTLQSNPRRCGLINGYGLEILPSSYDGGSSYTFGTRPDGVQWYRLWYSDWYFRTYVIPDP